MGLRAEAPHALGQCSTLSAHGCRTSSRRLRGEARLTPETIEAALPRDSARAARGRRQLQGRQGLHRPRTRPGDGAGRAWQPVAGAAGRPDRPRRDAGALRRRRGRPAARRRSGRASCCCSGCRARARRRRREAGALAGRSRAGIRCSCRPTCKRPAAIAQLNVVGRQASLRVHDPAGEMDPVARATGALAEARTLGFDAVIVDTAGRLHIDDELMDELVAIKAATGAGRPAVRGRRDDRAGRDQERRRVQPPDRRHRRRPDEDGRRRPRRRGAVGGGGRRRADRVRRQRRAAARTSSRSIPTASCRACWAWATCCRSSRRPKRRSIARMPSGSSETNPVERVHARGFPRSAQDDPEDGAARADPRDDARDGRHEERREIDAGRKQLTRVEAIIGSMTPRRAAEAAHHQRQPPKANRAGAAARRSRT